VHVTPHPVVPIRDDTHKNEIGLEPLELVIRVKIFTKVQYLRQCYYTGSEDKESLRLASVEKYGS